MRSTLLLWLFTVIVIGCGADGDKPVARSAQTPARAGNQPARKPIYREDDAIAIMRALDTAQIAMSQGVPDVSQNDDVLGYAAVVTKDHGAMLQLAAQTGVSARENAISARIRAHADSISRMLAMLPAGFNNTYMEEQVRAQRQALQVLDTALIPSARTQELRALLEGFRPTVLAHLQRALQILAMRRREANERGEPWVSGFEQLQQMREPQPAAPATPAESIAPTVPADTLPPVTTRSID